MKETLRMIRDTKFPERSNGKKMAQKDCSHKFQQTMGRGRRSDEFCTKRELQHNCHI
jgi:hypothetical protein